MWGLLALVTFPSVVYTAEKDPCLCVLHMSNISRRRPIRIWNTEAIIYRDPYWTFAEPQTFKTIKGVNNRTRQHDSSAVSHKRWNRHRPLIHPFWLLQNACISMNLADGKKFRFSRRVWVCTGCRAWTDQEKYNRGLLFLPNALEYHWFVLWSCWNGWKATDLPESSQKRTVEFVHFCNLCSDQSEVENNILNWSKLHHAKLAYFEKSAVFKMRSELEEPAWQHEYERLDMILIWQLCYVY